MLARTHALTGAVAWLALAPVITPGRPAEIAGGAVMAAGAALLPDLDHHSGTAAKTWGPLTRVLGRLIAWLCGGHRNGTHTLAAAAVSYAAVHLALDHAGWVAVAVVALLTGLALVACEDLVPGSWERLWPANLVASAAVAWWTITADVDLSWLPAAVAVGWLAHLAGDFVTDGGVPLFLPLDTTRYRLTRLNTGGLWERIVGALLAAAVVALLLATVLTYPDTWYTLLRRV